MTPVRRQCYAVRRPNVRDAARPSLAYLASQRVLRTAGYVPRFTVPPHASDPTAPAPTCGFCFEAGVHASIHACRLALGKATQKAKLRLAAQRRKAAKGPR